jgi:hypothetical protein
MHIMQNTSLIEKVVSMENLIEKNYLKVGIVLDSYKVTKWIGKIIPLIKLSTFLKASILIINQETPQKN